MGSCFKGKRETDRALWFPSFGNGEDVELIYDFDPSSWGKKIASEAACICLDYAQKNYHWNFVYALAYPENTASIRVLEKLGFTPDEKVLCFGKLLNHFSYKL